jgi:histidinol-phosphate aminotransferase
MSAGLGSDMGGDASGDATRRVHGGAGPQGRARWDFSSNGNAAGPCPPALAAVRAADVLHYPDASHQALREQLAALHGVALHQVLLAASASEFIQRISAVGARLAPGPVQLPALAYGDYALAARAHGRALVFDDGPLPATLRWCAEPSSPLGGDAPPPAAPGDRPTVLDLAYAPLRLSGRGLWTAADTRAVVQLHSPGKALGLLGVRGAYALLPAQGAVAWDVARWRQALALAAPSWPLGAQGEALLRAWALPATQQWVAASHATLRAWRQQLRQALAARGVALRDSVVPFFCARLALCPDAAARHGVAVRDAASFGLPGWVRLNSLSPTGQQALLAALDESPGRGADPAAIARREAGAGPARNSTASAQAHETGP